MIMKLKNHFLLLLALPMMMSCGSGGEGAGSAPAVVDTVGVVYDNIMTRRSVRKYKPQPVERAKMDSVVMCGLNAPNGQNRQAYEVRIVDDPEFINGVTKVYAEANPEAAAAPDFKTMFRNAPTVVFIAADTSYDMSAIDCGLLGGNMVLAAWSMGIGSCCLGSPTRFMLENPAAKPYLDKLGFSDGYKLLYVIGFGYPDETPAAKPRRTDMVRYVD